MSIFDDAKEAVSLRAFFESVGLPVVEIGKDLRSVRCPSGAICDDRPVQNADKYKVSLMRDGGAYFRCWSCGVSGDVVKAASLFWKCRQGDAAQKLLKDERLRKASAAMKTVMVDIAAQQQAVEHVANELFQHAGCSSEVRAYLSLRGIPKQIQEEAIERGLLAGLDGRHEGAAGELERICGRDALIAAGMLKDGKGASPVAYRPLLFRFGQHGFEARRIANIDGPGPKMLRYGAAVAPFVLPGLSDAHLITRSALDALSLRALGNEDTIHALPGESSWRSADDLRLPNPSWFGGIKGRCEIVFQGTSGSRDLAQQLAQSLGAAGIRASVAPLPDDCDMNTLLMQYVL